VEGVGLPCRWVHGTGVRLGVVLVVGVLLVLINDILAFDYVLSLIYRIIVEGAGVGRQLCELQERHGVVRGRLVVRHRLPTVELHYHVLGQVPRELLGRDVQFSVRLIGRPLHIFRFVIFWEVHVTVVLPELVLTNIVEAWRALLNVSLKRITVLDFLRALLAAGYGLLTAGPLRHGGVVRVLDFALEPHDFLVLQLLLRKLGELRFLLGNLEQTIDAPQVGVSCVTLRNMGRGAAALLRVLHLIVLYLRDVVERLVKPLLLGFTHLLLRGRAGERRVVDFHGQQGLFLRRF